MSTHTPAPWWVTESGIRDRGGYIAHTNSVQRYEGQDERYALEVARREADKRLMSASPDLLAALKLALPFLENEAVIQGYGFYRPANPHNFHPDHESCSEAEIANHKAACSAYDAGNYRDDYNDGWITPTLHITKAPWGIGSYTEDIPELKAQAEFCRAAITKAEGGAS